MTPTALAEAFGAELIGVDEDLLDGVCTWNGCECDDVLILVGADPWCIDHCLESDLPRLYPGKGLAACAQCGVGCHSVTADGTRLHRRCRRDFVARKVSVAKPMGAYARRMAKKAAG